MRRILVLQHVAHEILGTLNPLLKAESFRIRYVNFQRHPDAKVSLDGYNGLIVLGGPMGVYECVHYNHLNHEMETIEKALRLEMPVLGICLGSQLLAEVLGGKVRKSKEKEIGWCDVEVTSEGQADPMLKGFGKREKVFQLHGDTFDIPKGAIHLASSSICESQAFRYKKSYGLQFHLEVDEAMIQRWMKKPENVAELVASKGRHTEEGILADTRVHIDRSLDLSRKTFGAFIDLFEKKEKKLVLGSGHGKSRR